MVSLWHFIKVIKNIVLNSFVWFLLLHLLVEKHLQETMFPYLFLGLFSGLLAMVQG